MKNFAVMFLLSVSLQNALGIPISDLDKRPPAFDIEQGKVVFVDIKNAYYEVTYDLEAKKASIEAHLSFENAEKGMPVIDSLAQPTSIVLDGKEVSDLVTATPDKTTVVRVMKQDLGPGLHDIAISLPLETMVEFAPNGVKSAFWMGDLEDRNYIEKYLPTNFVFDRVPMTLKLKFKGGEDNQRIYTNGTVEKLGANEYKVTFQENLNISCPYFHTTPVGTYPETQFTYTSMDGRILPVTIYTGTDFPDMDTRLPRLKNLLTSLLEELEGDYGPFPHQSVTVFTNSNSGGMEYSGATITAEGSLGHELFHSYFARGVLPANGNAGWIDEALARWRDNHYPRAQVPVGTTRMANLGAYDRLTDRQAYAFGSKFMSMIDGKTVNQGGLKPFLRYMVKEHSFDPLTTEDLIEELNRFYGMDFTPDFKRYLYGEGQKSRTLPRREEDSFHRQFTEKELRSML